MTGAELQEVLDAIYNNDNSHDNYSDLRLYYDEVSGTAKIFKYTKGSKINIIAIFNPERIILSDSTVSAKLLKESIFSGTTVQVYDRGVGSYTDTFKIIKNSCYALGVSLDDDFPTKSPTFYQEMVDVVKEQYNNALENNIPTFVRKDAENVYRAYIPIMCLVALAIYLNNLGIFSSITILTPLQYPCNPLSAAQPANEWFDFMSKDEFVERVNYLWSINSQILTNGSYDRPLLGYWSTYLIEPPQALNNFLRLYEDEIDWNNNIIALSMNYNSQSGGGLPNPINYIDVYVYEFPKSCSFTYTYSDWHAPNKSLANRMIYNIRNNIEDFSLKVYHLRDIIDTVTHDESFEYDKEVTLKTKDTTVVLSTYTTVNNIKTNKYYKPYRTSNSFTCNISGTTAYYLSEKFNKLSYDTFYNVADLNLLNFKQIFRVYSWFNFNSNGVNLGFAQVYKILNEYNISWTDKDFVCSLRLGNDKWVIYIIREPNRIKLSRGQYFDFTETLRGASLQGTIPQNDINLFMSGVLITSGNMTQTRLMQIETDEQCTMETITLSIVSGTIHYEHDSVTDTIFGVGSTTESSEPIFDNLGKIINVDKIIPNGMSLVSGATYPTSVVDRSSFRTQYPSWVYKSISNPWFDGGELQDTMQSEDWGAISLLDAPGSQVEAQSGLIDFTDTDLIKQVTDDIEKSDIDDDTPPNPNKDKDPTKNKITSNIGSTPDPEPISNLAEPMAFGMLKTYVLTRQQMSQVGVQLASKSFWTAVNNLLSNPLDAIISLQSGYVVDTTGATSESVEINGYTLDNPVVSAQKLALTKCEFTLGSISIPQSYENYLDITNTQMIIYLPFVGYQKIDIGVFLGGDIRLVARVNNFTGDLVYYIYSDIDSVTRLMYTFSGNCQSQIPLKNDTFMRLFQALSGN